MEAVAVRLQPPFVFHKKTATFAPYAKNSYLCTRCWWRSGFATPAALM